MASKPQPTHVETIFRSIGIFFLFLFVFFICTSLNYIIYKTIFHQIPKANQTDEFIFSIFGLFVFLFAQLIYFIPGIFIIVFSKTFPNKFTGWVITLSPAISFPLAVFLIGIKG